MAFTFSVHCAVHTFFSTCEHACEWFFIYTLQVLLHESEEVRVRRPCHHVLVSVVTPSPRDSCLLSITFLMSCKMTQWGTSNWNLVETRATTTPTIEFSNCNMSFLYITISTTFQITYFFLLHNIYFIHYLMMFNKFLEHESWLSGGLPTGIWSKHAWQPPSQLCFQIVTYCPFCTLQSQLLFKSLTPFYCTTFISFTN